MPKKIKLQGLKIQSFITSTEQEKIRGGATLTVCQYPTAHGAMTCDPDFGPYCNPSNFTCGIKTCYASCRYCCVTDTCA
ncbi:MAG: hypothetical protein QG657_200 [Acidobacteriota bacterium]|nr:hypothetical protein [Acidobacteriota bacterium]